MQNNKTKFTKTKITFLNQNKYGQFWSQPLDAAAMDAISKLEPGAKLVVDSYPSKEDPTKKVHVLNIVPAHEVRASEAAYRASKPQTETGQVVDI